MFKTFAKITVTFNTKHSNNTMHTTTCTKCFFNNKKSRVS